MSHERDIRLSPFDIAHRVNISVVGATYGVSAAVHGHVKPREGFGDVRPWAVSLAECDYHVCSRNRRGEVWDKFAGKMAYVGKSQTEAEAISIWKAYLISIGVHADNAAVLRHD